MQLAANGRARQMVIFQAVLALLVAAFLAWLVQDGLTTAEALPAITAVIALAASLISLVGTAMYCGACYVRVDGDQLFRNGLALKSRTLDLTTIGGYTFSGDDLMLRAADGKGLMEIRCCYLSAEDAKRLLDYIQKYAGPMKLAPRRSILSMLNNR